MTTTVLVQVRGHALTIDVDADPPLGWRFWTFAGFPTDPVAPRPYGRSRGIPMTTVRVGAADLWLTAMELDDTAQLFTAHELFPCEDQAGAAEFGRAWIERHREQPGLFGGAP